MVGTTEDIVMAKRVNKTENSNTTPSTLIRNLNFEDTAQQLEALKAHIFNASESNQAKLAFIKEELSAGRYEMNSERIALKLLEHTLATEELELA
jgi:negative regulator of flagellin synthesis FlgM